MVRLNDTEEELFNRLKRSRKRRSKAGVFKDLMWEDGEQRGFARDGELTKDWETERANGR